MRIASPRPSTRTHSTLAGASRGRLCRRGKQVLRARPRTCHDLQIEHEDATIAFLAVLIAIEISINIRMCPSTNVIPVRLVFATALMAIARKVIIFDFEKLTPRYIYATAAVVLSLGLTCWLITKKA